MSNSSQLAILGGQPTRTEPFRVQPMVDADEEAMVLQAVRDINFSRYIGSGGENIEQQLRMTSAEAVENEEYWHFLGGPNVRAFAAEFAEKLDVPFAVPINSATTGISVALAAAGVGPGDEVIVPALSFNATGTAVLMFNSIPVFVDLDPETFCVSVEAVEAAITEHTKAILVVHLLGNVADMDRLQEIARRHDLKLIEDTAQAPGASWKGQKAGTIGDAGIFSFQQSKNIMTGEGGMIVTRDPEVARRARLLVNHGEGIFDESYPDEDLVNMVCSNFRMPELCAAVGRAQLKKLDFVNDWRTRNADVLREELGGLKGIDLPPSQRLSGNKAVDVPHLFVALFNAEEAGMSRDVFIAALREEGVPVGTGYPRPMYANPIFLRKVAYGRGGSPWTDASYGGNVEYAWDQCPVAEELIRDRFLWFYHIAYSSTEDDMRDIGRAVRKVLDNADALQAASADLEGKIGGHSQGRLGVAPSQMKNG